MKIFVLMIINFGTLLLARDESPVRFAMNSSMSYRYMLDTV